MAKWKPSDEQEFLRLRNDHTRKELAEIYGVTFEQIRYYLATIAPNTTIKTSDPAPYKEGPEGITVSSGINSEGIKTETLLANRDIRSVAELMELYSIDPAEWEVIDFECKQGSWDGFWKDADSQAQVKTLYRYACKARFRPTRKIVRDAFADARALIADAKDYMPVYPKITRRASAQHEHCLQINIPDLHLGKLCWAEETGFENYDVNIAETLFFEALDAALAYGQTYDVGKIVFPIGNDLLNCDGSDNMTTAGTPQSEDGRHKKTFRRTRKMIVTALEMCREIAPVEALIIPGNHDADSIFHLGDSIQGWMNTANDVVIDNTACNKKTFTWGANGILLTHGEEKMNDLALTFASDFPDVWQRTSYHEVHCGHLHTMKAQDYRGCWVRFISSLTGTDYWHARHNYRSRRSALFCIWQLDGRQSYFQNFNAPDDRILRAQDM
jgi:hypothetical protein